MERSPRRLRNALVQQLPDGALLPRFGAREAVEHDSVPSAIVSVMCSADLRRRLRRAREKPIHL
jgi:hypothetical protein